eukprot:scaffold88345_cov58-Phaeocystis_antarctica.AAC.4
MLLARGRLGPGTAPPEAAPPGGEAGPPRLVQAVTPPASLESSGRSVAPRSGRWARHSCAAHRANI